MWARLGCAEKIDQARRLLAEYDLAEVGDDEELCLDPNGCKCDSCRAALAVIRSVIAQDAHFTEWERELRAVAE